ncbi:MAG: Ig-like domain-containing protein [Gammaproteobacteria bacterium]|jgi:hypothetical protein|nr:Ig-like domain-containing protein [Gammaproteobacteria bacterium]MBQ0773548.1 Ig-like domain-containing protein [Gammaproteobacteria bacterium]
MIHSIIKFVAIVACATTLVSCGDEKGEITPSTLKIANNQGIVYSYPRDRQNEVPTPSPMVLRFSSAIVDTFPQNLITLRNDQGEEIDYAIKKVGNGHGLVLTPELPLAPLTEYTLDLGEINLADGISRARQLIFSTRGLSEGPRDQVAATGDFALRHVIPDGVQFPILDFTSFRLQFSQPINRSSLRYGDTLSLQGPNGLVNAQVLVSGPYLTLDPVEDLTPGAEYHLVVEQGVESVYGESFSGTNITFFPKSSGSRSTLAQEVEDSLNGSITSELTGEAINTVPLSAVLLGPDNQSQQTGSLNVELAHIPTFPDSAPLRIKRGSLLNGSIMDVKIGGHIPTGFDSGPVSIRFISDAIGYMVKNPYSDLIDAPRQIILYMDVAISTGDSRASGAVTQNLLHLELVGTAIVNEGRLVVNAISMAQPSVMGVEESNSLLSFNMRGHLDQVNPPPPTEDAESPYLHSWVADDYLGLYRPDEAIIVQMSEPLDTETIRVGDNFTLTDSGGANIPFQFHQHGAALVVQPNSPLDYGQFYWLGVVNDVRDLSGNAVNPTTRVLDIPEYSSSDPRSPIVLTAYPGFPCVLVDTNLSANDSGRCSGGKPSDDHLPLPSLPANRAINVTFSQPMDAGSINNNTFIVEHVDANGVPIGAPIEGTITHESRSVIFTPHSAWLAGDLYRYTVKSVLSSPNCGTDAICDTRGYPVQTQLLSQTPSNFPAATAGGPSMSVFFRGTTPTTNVLLTLHNLPNADFNTNFKIDDGETKPSTHPQAVLNSAQLVRNPSANPDADGTAGSGITVKDANVGCGFNESDEPLICPDETFIHPSGNLNADIVGFLSADDVNQQYPSDLSIPETVRINGGVLVYIYPTRIVLSGTVVHTKLTEAVSTGCGGGVGLCFIARPTPTGPQLMRVKYSCNPAAEECSAPDFGRAKGWIVEENGRSQFHANLSLYLDAPSLAPDVVNDQGGPVPVTHDLYSKELDLQLSGELGFLDDGRQRIEEISSNALNIEVLLNIAGLFPNEKIYLTVPAGATVLNYISDPIKP